MDTQYVGGPGLVYHNTSPFFDHHSRPFSLLHGGQQSMSWQPQPHTSPPNSSASTNPSLSGTSLYPTVNTADNIDYPSASAHLTQPRSANTYAPPTVGESSRPDASLDSPQITSSAGPSRLPRRRARTNIQYTSRSYGRRAHSLAFAGQSTDPEAPLRHPPPPPYVSISSDLEGALGIAPYPLAYYEARAASSSATSSNPRSASPANSVLSMTSSRTSWSSRSASGSHQQRQESPEEGRRPPSQQSQPQQSKPERKKMKLWSTDRKKICVFHRENPGLKQEEIALTFGVERSTVSKILKEKDRWLNVKDDEKMQVSKWRPTKFPDIENLMHEWLDTVSDDGVVFTDALIRAKARDIADRMGYTEEKFKASSGWVENFKARQGIKKGKLTGAGTDVQRARALGWGFLAVANEPTFKPEEMAWPPPPPERVEPIEAGPAPVPEPVPLLVRAEGGQTQEVYVMPKVKIVEEVEGPDPNDLDEAERLADALCQFADKRADIVSRDQRETLREILVNIVRHHD